MSDKIELMFIKCKIKKPCRKELKSFAILLAFFVIFLPGLIFPHFFKYQFPVWPFIIGFILFLSAMTIPKALVPLYLFWMVLGYGLSWVNTRLILGFVFIAMFIPTGMIMKIFGKNPMSTKLGKNLESYRLPSRVRDKNHFERPY